VLLDWDVGALRGPGNVVPLGVDEHEASGGVVVEPRNLKVLGIHLKFAEAESR